MFALQAQRTISNVKVCLDSHGFIFPIIETWYSDFLIAISGKQYVRDSSTF